MSKVRANVIAFIKTPVDSLYEFIFTGTENELNLYIRSMRTDLSRLRGLVRKRGKVPKHFKMLVVNKEPQANNQIKVIMSKTYSNTDITNQIDEIIGDLAGGNII